MSQEDVLMMDILNALNSCGLQKEDLFNFMDKGQTDLISREDFKDMLSAKQISDTVGE